jgi:hypothetical protein
MSVRPQLTFYQLSEKRRLNDIWQELLEKQIWKKADFAAHEHNTLIGSKDRTNWRLFLPDHLQIYDGQEWVEEQQTVIDPHYAPNPMDGDMDTFLQKAHRFLRKFEGRKIGVQLSGGLDSSLIIGLLEHFHIPYGLVGLRSDRYEFRTERLVQEKIAQSCSEVEFIDEVDCLPCSNLKEVPSHQIPDLLSLNYAQDLAMAQACNRLGIEVLLSGGGGDNLLGEAVPRKPEACEWRPQTFTDQFPVEIVYQPAGISFTSFFGDRGIVDAFFSLRRGMKDDYKKVWARGFFKDFLPKELIEYTYCADFWGRDIDALINAIPWIRKMHHFAEEHTQNEYFEQKNLENLLSEDLLRPRKELYQIIEARISSALWVHSIVRSSY